MRRFVRQASRLFCVPFVVVRMPIFVNRHLRISSSLPVACLFASPMCEPSVRFGYGLPYSSEFIPCGVHAATRQGSLFSYSPPLILLFPTPRILPQAKPREARGFPLPVSIRDRQCSMDTNAFLRCHLGSPWKPQKTRHSQVPCRRARKARLMLHSVV